MDPSFFIFHPLLALKILLDLPILLGKMASNNFQSLSHSALSAKASTMQTAMTPTPANYGVTASQVTTLGMLRATFAQDILDVAAARDIWLGLVQKQKDDQKALVDQMVAMSKLAYAKSGITDQQLATAGLAIHDTQPSPILPVTPTFFQAQPFSNGDVELQWNRNGNKQGVTFVIETSANGSTGWTQVGVTKKRKLTIGGFAPGTPAWFRVRAENRGLYSTPSNVVTIYSSQIENFLQLAA